MSQVYGVTLMEKFKSLDTVTVMDPRFLHIVSVDRITGTFQTITLHDHHSSISRFFLADIVPEVIRSHFNTARNVLLYTWFAYGLYPVAELQALNGLELALKTRIGDTGLKNLKKQRGKHNKALGLQSYIEHAATSGWIRNEDFQAYHRVPYEQAKWDLHMKKIQEMKDKGLTIIDVDESEIVVPEVNTTDFIAILIDTVNKIRNIHAHGEVMLYPASVWQTFEICTDFINALFRSPSLSA